MRTLATIALAIIPWATLAGVKDATDPKQAGPDYALQGEYLGKVHTKEGEQSYGAQVIALGDGSFRVVGYHGGLPGAGWDRSEKKQLDGKLQGDSVAFTTDHSTATLKGDTITVVSNEGKEVGKLTRTTRSSPTLGMKPPEGATVLFDGSNANEFHNGRMTPDNLLMQGVTSKKKFQNMTVHLEFMLPFMPKARSQGRANSGCYLQGRYEVQILDSFGLEGKNNECGGIYEIRDPNVNMCLPPLVWQTYDIEYRAPTYQGSKKVANAKITVIHNGVAVHEDVELPRATRAAPVAEGPEPGPIYLQDHGNPVRFRNIWVVAK